MPLVCDHNLQKYFLIDYSFILTGTLKVLIAEVAIGSSVKTLCEKGDALLLEETGKVSNKFKVFFLILNILL